MRNTEGVHMTVKQFLKGIMWEAEGPSLTRVLTVFAVFLFTLVTLYLVFAGHRWEHYDTFASIAGGGGLLGQVGNKFINSKWNRSPRETERQDPG